VVRKSPLGPVAVQLLRDAEAKAKIKAKGRIAKLLAKKRGELKRMPLTGKAALKAIAAGKW
jgi:hypothetical protein